MTANCYVLYDVCKESFEMPMFARNDRDMARILYNEFKKYQDALKDDYKIVFIGKYDLDHGCLIDCSPSDSVQKFLDFGDRSLRTFLSSNYHIDKDNADV